jgi:hypothetical protein
MTRGATSGFELQSMQASGVNCPDGWTNGTTAPVIDIGTKRSGLAAAKCAGGTTATSYLIIPGVAPANTGTAYCRVWLYLDALPTATRRVLALVGAGNAVVASIRLSSAGTLQLWIGHGTAPVQIGSDSAAVPLNAWFCVELSARNAATTNQDTLEGRWGREGEPPVSFAVSTTADFFGISDLPGRVMVGWIDAPGQAANLWVDDVSQNIDTGTWAKSWPDAGGRVVALPPKRLVSAGTWTTDKGTTTEADIVAALSSTPPIGTTDGTAAATPHQIRSIAAASTAAPDWCEVECWSYGRAGIPGPALVEAAGGTYQALGDAAARTRAAQGFYLASGVVRLELNLRSVGSPTDDLAVAVQTDSAGAPSGTGVGSATIPAASITGTAAWVAVDLLAPLTPRGKYWLVLTRAGAVDAANYYQLQKSTANAYYDGGVALHNGASWGAVVLADALMFRAYNDVGAAQLAALLLAACHGEGAATGTKTGKLGLTNPAGQTDATIPALGGDLGACGAYPTNWFWASVAGTGGLGNVAVPSMADSPRLRIGKTDSGTRAADCCWLGCMVEYVDPAGWLQLTKVADATLWWAKPVATTTTGYYDNAGTETAVICRAGDWFLTADPLPAEGVMLTNLTTATDADIKANYTPV